MRSSGFSLTLLIAASGLVAPELALADRRTSLAGNILIEDPDDLFPFPQYTLQHRNMIRLDYGGTTTANNQAGNAAGNGIITMGNERKAFGIALHRGDLLTPDVVGFNQELAWLSGVEGIDPFGNAASSTFPGPAAVDVPAAPVMPATVVDFSMATKLGDNPFGLRLGFGRGVQAVRNGDDEVTKGAQTFFAGQVGFSGLSKSRVRWDMSGNLVFAFAKATDDDVDQNSGWDLRAGGLLRLYVPINDLVDIGVIGNVSFDNEHTKDEPADDASNDFVFGMMAAAGPAIHLERAKIAAYAGLRKQVGRLEPSSAAGEDETNRLRFAAPLVNLAVEVQVLDWLYVRTGAEYAWEVRRDGAEDQKERVADSSFRWSAGLGVEKAGFAFDGVITNEFMTSGPNFIGGNANGFLAMASLTYKFGDVFSRSARTPVESTASRPLVQPIEPTPSPPPPPPPAATAAPPTAAAEPDQELAPPPIEKKAPPRTPTTSRTANKRGTTP